MHATRSRRPAQKGFTFVEMAVVLVVGGLLSWAAFSAYDTVLDAKDRRQAQDMARQAQSQLRAFAVRHGRLPCPDASVAGTGQESLAGGVCGTGNLIGWFPYVSVGADLPVAEYRARYAVYRAPNASAAADADLALNLERSGDAPGHVNHRDVSDLIVALNNVAGLALATDKPYLTGDGGVAGAVDCATNRQMSVAYWLASGWTRRRPAPARVCSARALPSVPPTTTSSSPSRPRSWPAGCARACPERPPFSSPFSPLQRPPCTTSRSPCSSPEWPPPPRLFRQPCWAAAWRRRPRARNTWATPMLIP